MSSNPNSSASQRSCAIITLHTPHNFGAMLQAYALQTALSSLGTDPEIIDYGPHPGVPKLFNRKSWLKQIPHMLLCMLQSRARKRRYERFKAFRDDFLNLTRPFPRYEDLIESPPEHDVLVCGSDQIWNPTHHPLDPAYFLQFGLPRSKRVAYAPSFGLKTLPSKYHDQLHELLGNIDFLSCRESSGARLIESTIQRPAVHVVDPTLLVSRAHWQSIAKNPEAVPAKYLLVYALENSPALLESVTRIGAALSLPVVCIQTGVRTPPFPCSVLVRDAGPLEFLGYMENADFVITNSFHGAVFSMLFRKQFFSPPHSSLNERLSSLFATAGTSNCQNLDRTLTQLPKAIDYDSVQPNLDQAVSISLAFLKDAVLAPASSKLLLRG